MTTPTWCEHCRESFPEDHYEERGQHKVGKEWGPEGVLLAAARAVSAVRALCEDRQAKAADGSMTDVDTIWPSEILALLDGEARRSCPSCRKPNCRGARTGAKDDCHGGQELDPASGLIVESP